MVEEGAIMIVIASSVRASRPWVGSMPAALHLFLHASVPFLPWLEHMVELICATSSDGSEHC